MFFLLLWLQVKDVYGNAITRIASNIISFVTDIEFKEVKEEKGKAKAFFIYRVRGNFSKEVYTGEKPWLIGKEGVKQWLIGIELIDANIYTFQTPLTFAIMGGLFLFIKKRRRAYAEVVLILFFIHLLHVFTAGIAGLSSGLVSLGFVKATGLIQPGLWKSLWAFVHGMVLWFSPFLIGAYLYLRFSDF